ncbi:Dolichyl-phosphate-mannose-protein mannosyltransferase [Micromonospora rhizosphaerae]|uniref:Dolichyl-phosphate-mannose-protein mannosyltransferase n=1 Tax=Micromonospora rhizosphaerae TaxID=568872 RepID=A0A1C6SDM7_9ACTN|nr:glycosyltransferase family 39 protein [Micromonospora rhizosphaerae]SCL27604.1 Dolichyl-phosphate-mannose-protein mannosyltransferase [Micromonospora rhizosphaerae]
MPFLWAGLGMDEGGYAHVVQQWSRGARLYGEAWLDRPQGLLLTYRILLWVNDDGWTIRLGAVLAGLAITVLVGLIGWLLVGRRAGVTAAGLYAVVGVAPNIEGFTLNGELLASAPATLAVAAALLWHRYRSAGWLVTAGLAAGVATTMKPSGLDGIAAGLVVVLLGTRPGRVAGSPPALFLSASAVPVGLSALHGWHLGWHEYWTALAGYQFAAMGGPVAGPGARWADFTSSLGPAARDLAVVAAAAGVGLRRLRGSRSARRVLLAWLGGAALGVNLGGSYWPHYYLQLLPPLTVLAAAAIATIRRPRLRTTAAVTAVLPQLVWLAALVPATPDQRQHRIPYYGLARRDERIAAVIRTETSPEDRIFVLVSESNIYFLAQRTTDYPYLWGKPIEKIPDALPRLRGMLDGPDRPALVVLNSDPGKVDRSGELGRILASHYRTGRMVDGVPLLTAA